MTDRQYVIRACQMLGVDLIMPTRAAPDILGVHWVNGYGHVVIDARKWSQAREQLRVYQHQRANR